MRESAKKLIRSVLLGAVASLSSTNSHATAVPTQPTPESLLSDNNSDVSAALRHKVFKNVLQVTRAGVTNVIAGHRSHMSHRSGGGGGGGHYSHASHYSSYNGGGSSHSSHSSHSSSSYTGGSTSSRTVAPKPAPKNYKSYVIGDRTLRTGLYGNDVTFLTTLLVQKHYLRSSWITTQKGYAVYDARVADAVRRFQKDAGLTQDGNVTTVLTDKLTAWDSNRTTYVLGLRDLSYESQSPMAGADVGELIALLKQAGYPPNPQKLQYANGKAVFTADVAIAVKLFQAYNALSPNGVADEATVAKLKARAK